VTGHTPTILELTPAAAGTAINALLALLRRSYRIAALRGSQLRTHPGRLVGSISLGNHRVTLTAQARPDSEDGSREHVIVDIDSGAYEAAYDLFRERANPHARQALVEFCVEVAAALQVEGFQLRFAGEERPPLSVNRLVEAITSTNNCGLVCGLATSSEASTRVRGYWFSAVQEIAGYLIVVTI
jgi:hypothetical protein